MVTHSRGVAHSTTGVGQNGYQLTWGDSKGVQCALEETGKFRVMLKGIQEAWGDGCFHPVHSISMNFGF